MNVLWLYQIPTWLLGALTVVIFSGGSVAGLAITRRWVGHWRHHNDVVAAFVAAVGVLYAVLLAMIAVACWNNYTTVGSLVSQEANLVHALFRDLGAYPEPVRDDLRHLLREYVATVIHDEWPALRAGGDNDRAALVVDRMFKEWMAFQPQNTGQQLADAEMLARLNTFQSIRESRIQEGIAGLDATLWAVVLVGAVINVGLTYLFWIEDIRLHRRLVFTLGLTIGLVVYLILALDHPLWGDVSIQPTPFRAVARSMDRELQPLTPGERRLVAQ
ncbi:MAG: DUF4239 domain-containing protein [Acidobacteriota bacterium]|nr:DUF4239 domain-containing protein [Acidobacteriota bacterium]